MKDYYLQDIDILIAFLKEQCQEDFAVLGPLCAKTITLRF